VKHSRQCYISLWLVSFASQSSTAILNGEAFLKAFSALRIYATFDRSLILSVSVLSLGCVGPCLNLVSWVVLTPEEYQLLMRYRLSRSTTTPHWSFERFHIRLLGVSRIVG
jgi:hypothetical protein